MERMKLIFEPGDFDKMSDNPAESYEEAVDIANAKLTSLGIDAETPERLKRLEEQVADLESALLAKSGEIGDAEHRGNTVDYIYDKLENYSHQLSECCKRLSELERMIAEAPVFYAQLNDGKIGPYTSWHASPKDAYAFKATHRARLVQIIPLDKDQK